ncbi:MAG: T9SS type A sorting domain-containing protein, partial [Candidatus Eisenbacteria bacterium]|nr:T9SS type A sorting domain-containing protein [Candidatus Eisenbacteria bacterium]
PHELPGQVEILANPRVYGSFQSGSKSRGLIGDFTLYTSVMPLALEEDHWTCDFDSLSDGHFSWGVFTDQGNGLYYERGDGVENEEEDMRYAGDGATATVLNPGPGTRTHSMTAVKAGTYEESVCAIESLAVTAGDSVVYEVTSDGGLRVDNYGPAATYDLRAMLVDGSGEDLFVHEGIEISGTTRHRIALNWPTHGGELSIAVDYGLNGTVDETIWVADQSGWSDVPESGAEPGITLVARSRPNPFRTGTTLEYYMPERGHVTADVYDAAGRKVATLADGFREAGWHRIEWRPDDAPSGVYFCSVRTAERAETLKIVRLE